MGGGAGVYALPGCHALLTASPHAAQVGNIQWTSWRPGFGGHQVLGWGLDGMLCSLPPSMPPRWGALVQGSGYHQMVQEGGAPATLYALPGRDALLTATLHAAQVGLCRSLIAWCPGSGFNQDVQDDSEHAVCAALPRRPAHCSPQCRPDRSMSRWRPGSRDLPGFGGMEDGNFCSLPPFSSPRWGAPSPGLRVPSMLYALPGWDALLTATLHAAQVGD